MTKYNSDIAIIKHYTEKVEEALKENDLNKAYSFSHALDDIVRDLAFEIYHEFLRESQKEL